MQWHSFVCFTLLHFVCVTCREDHQFLFCPHPFAFVGIPFSWILYILLWLVVHHQTRSSFINPFTWKPLDSRIWNALPLRWGPSAMLSLPAFWLVNCIHYTSKNVCKNVMCDACWGYVDRNASLKKMKRSKQCAEPLVDWMFEIKKNIVNRCRDLVRKLDLLKLEAIPRLLSKFLSNTAEAWNNKMFYLL